MIYFLKDHASGLVKVGFTANAKSLAARLHDYSTHCPGPTELLRTFDGDRSVERDLHGLLYEHSHRGEWFRVTLEHIEAALATPGLGRLFLRTHEAGKVVGCDASIIWRRAAEGRIPACAIGGDGKSKWLVTRAWAESVRGTLVEARLDPATVPAMVEAYERGETLATIGKRYGWSGGSIRNALANAGVTIRGPIAPVPAERKNVKRGEHHHISKLTEAAVIDIRRRMSGGEKSASVARAFGVSVSLVQKVHHRTVWKHVA